MAQKEFNLDLERYLDSRREGEREKFDFSKLKDKIKFPKFKFKKRKKENIQEDFEKELEEVNKENSLRGLNEEVVSDDFIEEEELVTPRMSLFSIIKNFFKRERILSEEEIMEEINSSPELKVVDEDLKIALRIQNEWLKKLPAKAVKEFKESADYFEYKRILEEYGLIKE